MRRFAIALVIASMCGSVWTLAVADNPAPVPTAGGSKDLANLAVTNPDLVPFLLQQMRALRDSEAESSGSIDNQRLELSRVLVSLGQAIVPEIINALSSEDPKMRMAALAFLCVSGSAPEFPIARVVPGVLKLAKTDPDGEIRNVASIVLVTLLRFAGDEEHRRQHHEWFLRDGT